MINKVRCRYVIIWTSFPRFFDWTSGVTHLDLWKVREPIGMMLLALFVTLFISAFVAFKSYKLKRY